MVFETSCGAACSTCDRSKAGRFVDRVRLNTETPGDASFLLPDLVIHWSDAAEASPLQLTGWKSEARPAGTKFSSPHAELGFCILPGKATGPATEMDAKDLGARICTLAGP